MVYTLPRAIKEEKKNEERVGSLKSKKGESKVGKLKRSEEEKRERRSRGVGFLIFFFISVQGSAEREYFNRRGRFPFLLNRERVPRE